MGCQFSQSRVEGVETERDEFEADAEQQGRLREALNNGSFSFAPTEAPLLEREPSARPEGASAAKPEDEAVVPIGRAKCISDYDSGEEIDLRLYRGDAVVVVERIEDTWLRGYIEGEPTTIGFFPANFVSEEAEESEAPAAEQAAAGGDADEVAHEQRTVWVGNIPESQAHEFALRELFGRFGELDNITIRRKETAEHGPNKSWCFVSFVAPEAAAAAVEESGSIEAPDEAGEGVGLRVRVLNLVAELSKPTTGALGGIWEDHKSLLGAALRAELHQDGDGITAGMTMGKIEKALDLEATGHKAEKQKSADEELESPGSEGLEKTRVMTPRQKINSPSFANIRQISQDFDSSVSSISASIFARLHHNLALTSSGEFPSPTWGLAAIGAGRG